jgi:hypothetical protein
VEGDKGPVKVTEDVFVQVVDRVDRGKHVGGVLKGRELYIRDEGNEEFKIREGEYVSNFSKMFREYLTGGVKEEGGNERAARPKTSTGNDIVDIVDKFDVTIIDDMGNGVKEKETMTVDSFVEEVRRGNEREDGNWVKVFKVYMDNKVNDCVGWIRITAQTVDRYWVEGDVILDWEDESYRFVSKDRISIFEQIVKEDLFWYDWAEGISYTTDGPRDSNMFHFYYFGNYREEIYNKDGFKLIVSTHHGVELHVGESMSDFNVGRYPTEKDWRFMAMMVGFKELVKAIRNFEDKRDGVEDSARPKIEIDSPKDI